MPTKPLSKFPQTRVALDAMRSLVRTIETAGTPRPNYQISKAGELFYLIHAGADEIGRKLRTVEVALKAAKLERASDVAQFQAERGTVGYYPGNPRRGDASYSKPHLDALKVAIELFGDAIGTANPARNKPQRKREWVSHALVIVSREPHLADAEIAKRVGIHPSQLSRDRFYRDAASTARGKSARGVVTRDRDGHLEVEAVDD